MKKAIILGVAVVVIGGVIWFSKDSTDGGALGLEDVKYTEPAEAVDGFYGLWLKASQDSSAEPSRAALAMSSTLTQELSAKLSATLQSGSTLDPVLCQSVVPQDITIRNVYEQADKAELLVTSKDKSVTKQAVVSLAKSGDRWLISNIQCNDGETGVEREFSFEREGFLIKNSIPKPFNNKNWHIVFTQDGVPGNAAPLIFDSKSQCTSLEGVKAVCKPEKFTEASKISVRGQMTERGVSVVSLEFVK